MAAEANRWLFKQANGKYKIKFTLNGKGYQKYLETTDVKLARQIRDKWRLELEQEVLLKESGGGLLGSLMARLEPTTKTYPTILEYYTTVNERFWANKASEIENKQKIDHFVDLMGNLTLNSITADTFYDYKVTLRNEGKKAGTINRYTAPLRFILRKAKFFGVIDSVPSFEEESEKGNERTKVYSEDEARNILAFFKDSEDNNMKRMYHFIILASFLGQRRGDIMSFTMSNVIETPDGRALLKFKASKQSKQMIVPLPTVALASFKELYALNDDPESDPESNPLVTKNSQPLVGLTKDQIQHYWRKMKDYMGYKSNDGVNIHTFRHTYVTNLLAMGVPVAHVQKLVGHANIATTQRYEHLSAVTLSQALDQIGW